MSAIYQVVGRLLLASFIDRYRRKLQLGGGAVLVALLIGAYLAASRSVEEG